ncbi:MAG: MBL fold metallo-hydrolase [Salibacteraceae bacterium]
MKVIFLGTGTSQGIPVIGSDHPVCMSKNPKDKRLRTSVYLEVDGVKMVIDTGPDFRTQMLDNNIQRLDAVLFTHEHRDHVAGFDDIRPFNFKQKMDMPVYGDERVCKGLKQAFPYIFVEKNRYPGAPGAELHQIENKPFEVNGVEVTPIEVMHMNLPVFGYRFNDFTYITDAKTIAAEELEKIKGTKVLVLNALRVEEHYSHFNLEEALAVVDMVKPERAYFTHISHLLGFHDEVSNQLPKNVFLAYDGLEITI